MSRSTSSTAEGSEPGQPLARHPAVLAWRRLDGRSFEPEAVDQLKPAHRKSAVYRLRRGGSSVIAKRCLQTTVQVERTVYEEVLPSISLPRLSCLGVADDDDSGTAWLFVEDAGDAAFTPDLATHREAAARWLGRLHVHASRSPALTALPDRGPGCYLGVARRAASVIGGNLSNPAFDPHHREILEKVVAHCGVLESRAREVKSLCGVLPPTLVHGGFGRKNVRVRGASARLDVLAFDWEFAGRGTPAADISCVDVETYWVSVSETWPDLEREAIHRLSELGTVFWCLSAIPAEEPSLAGAWVGRVMGKMQYYETSMARALGALGWAS